jgi:hypothetical protein
MWPPHLRRAAGRWIAVAGAAAVALLTLLPGSLGESTAQLCIICGTYGGVDALLNVALFVPLGFGLAVGGAPARRAIVALCLYSLVIEALQFRGVPGRDASAGDVVMNSLGGCLGFLLGRFLPRLVAPSSAGAWRLAASWLGLWLGVQALVGYSLLPTPPPPPYYGQIARPPRTQSRVEFPGRVLSASIGPEPVLRGELRNARSIMELLARPGGVEGAVQVIPAGFAAGRAEIVIISGPEMVGVLSFEQEGESFVFGIRTGAEVMRLRPYEFELRNAFAGIAAASGVDSLMLRARYATSTVTVRAVTVGRDVQHEFVPRLSYGWRLLLPFQLYVNDDALARVAGAAFVALLILPAGYWARFARGPLHDKTPPPALVSGAAALVLLAGFVGVPAAVGLRPAALWEWGCLVAGIALGLALGTTVARRRPTVVSTEPSRNPVV